MKRTTIKDIARIVGVTHVTVSKVINNKGRISQETRKKVLDAIERLEYYPNYAARSLVKGKTNNIAVVEPGFSAGFPSSIIRGIQDAHSKTSYDINLYSSRATGEGAEHIFKRIVNEKRADVVIVVSIGMSEKFLHEYKKAGIPVILIESEAKGASSILADNEKGAYSAAEFLIKRGRRNIGVVAGDRVNTRPQAERYAGFIRALNDNDLGFAEDRIFTTVQYSYDDGRQAFRSLGEKDVDAIFSIAGDLVAYGLLDEARKEGMRVPTDISIIGYDDDLMSTSLDLTTVKQPIYEMGKRAFELAAAADQGKLKKPQTIVFETELKIRGTA